MRHEYIFIQSDRLEQTTFEKAKHGATWYRHDSWPSGAFKRFEQHHRHSMTDIERYFAFYNERKKPEPAVKPEIAAAFEFGYRCAEKGMNLQAALAELHKIGV